ncbi:MAG: DUF1343 domain-containing protein [Myxococcaceae bacterium]|nr:DUF1343 domain-containing protein [Myxococcaceae bacterium]
MGAIVNPTSVDSQLRHLADLLAAAPGVKLGALFGPEHGVRGEAQYMEAVGEVARDRHTGVPVHSLYGSTEASLSPREEWLHGLDALVFDIQDVGSRYYTYVWTLALAMKVAARQKLKVVVLDRPNPIGGAEVEGNLVGEGFRSFVGLYPVPNRHGMTAGEIARLVNADIGAELVVVPCEGWRRTQRWPDTGLPFIPPSPNMPTPDTALVYPGMCLLEGTNLSEGRGTCRPFEQFGAPYLEARATADALEALRLPGVRFRPVSFTPTFDKHRGVSCEGAFMHVTDARAFRPLLTGLAVVEVGRRLGGAEFRWRRDAYEFVDQVPAFDLLCGAAMPRERLEAGEAATAIAAALDAELPQFLPRRARVLLYE